MLNFLTKPDFIAYNHFMEKGFFLYSVQKTFQTGECCMDHKNQKELEEAEKTFDVIILTALSLKKRS